MYFVELLTFAVVDIFQSEGRQLFLSIRAYTEDACLVGLESDLAQSKPNRTHHSNPFA